MFLRLVKAPEVSLAALIPNLLTTLALTCGLASIHFAIKASMVPIPEHAGRLWDWALGGILFSAIFDALDGRAARLLRVTSKFGAVLDSLSDFVSFGVAPAIILHQQTLGPLINQPGPRSLAILGLVAVMVFPLCSALRLARFTSAAPSPKSASNYFVGMPTPAAAAAVMVPAMLEASPTFNWEIPMPLIIVYTLGISFLMISRVPMFALKKLRINRLMVAPLLVVVGILVVVMTQDPWLVLSILALAYLLSLPWAVIMRRRVPAHDAPAESGLHAAPVEAPGISVSSDPRT